jgi:hypothetical protein
MRFLRLAAAACVALLLAACAATGPKFAEVEASLPRLRAGEGRIFVFRSNSPVGAALSPDVRINGEVAGTPQVGSFFFVDRPAGHYTASARTESESTVDFVLGEGQTVYVSLHISMGILVGRPQLLMHPPETGTSVMRGMAYIGSIPLVPGRPDPITAGAVPGGTARAKPTQPVQAQSARSGAVTMDDLRGLLPAKP